MWARSRPLPFAGGNPFSLDMSSQAARAPGPCLRSGCSTSANAELQRRDDGDGLLLGKRAAVPADTGGLGRTAHRVAGAREVCQRCHVELLLQLLLSCWLLRRWRPCWLHVYLRCSSLGGAPEGNGGSCGPLLEESMGGSTSSPRGHCLHSRSVNGLSGFSSQALHSQCIDCIPGQRPSAASMPWTWAPASRYKQRP